METLAMRMAREGWIIHPQQGKIKFLARPFQRKFWGDTSKRRVINKARQIGMSQAVGAEAIDRAMERTCTILMISRNEDQAIQLLGYCKTIYNNLDSRPILLISENTRRMAFANNSVIISLPANKSTGRGFAASHVYFDEAAWAMYATQIWQSIAPSIALGGTITVLSSPNGPDNLFGEICEGKRGEVKPFDGVPAPDGVWSYHHIPWTENPAYTTEDPNWYRDNRGNYDDDEWASEFLASLQGSGERVFDHDKIEAMLDGWLERNDLDVFDDEIFNTEPLPGHQYVNAADLGRKHDPFVIVSLDVTLDVHHLVAFERYHHMDYNDQEERMAAFYHTYPGWNVMDASGLGDPVWQAMELNGYSMYPFVFSRTTKPNLVDELVRSTHHGTLKQGVRAIMDEMDRYRRKDEKIKQDTVMALGMAEFVSRHLDLEQTYSTEQRVDDVSQGFGRLG
jgi:phage FluMu gp28-like protein